MSWHFSGNTANLSYKTNKKRTKVGFCLHSHLFSLSTCRFIACCWGQAASLHPEAKHVFTSVWLHSASLTLLGMCFYFLFLRVNIWAKWADGQTAGGARQLRRSWVHDKRSCIAGQLSRCWSGACLPHRSLISQRRFVPDCDETQSVETWSGWCCLQSYSNRF